MRQKLYVFYFSVAILFSVIACNPSAKKDKGNEKLNRYYTEDSLKNGSDVIEIRKYKYFADGLDTKDVESTVSAIDRYKSDFKDKRVGLCDTAFMVLQSVVDSIELDLNVALIEDTTDYSTLYLKKTLSSKVADFKSLLNTNGFDLKSVEGIVYIVQDRSYLLNQISAMVSETLKTYLTQIADETAEGFVEDAFVTITPNQFVDRVLWYENFIHSNPDFMYIENCETNRESYLTYLFVGLDNTRLYDNEELMVLNPFYSTAYDYLLKTYPQSETAKLLVPYYKAIKENKSIVVSDLIGKYVDEGLIFDMY